VALASSADTGGATITSYNLQWDAGSSQANWSDLVGLTSSYLGSEFVATTNVVAGQAYAVRIRAFNAHGWGAFSPAAVIAASAAPD
jgi:hypothetical protein